MMMPALGRDQRPRGHAVSLWAGAALVAGLAHGGALWLALQRPSGSGAPASPPPAVTIELAPEAVAPESGLLQDALDVADVDEVVAPQPLEAPDVPAMARDLSTPTPEVAPLAPIPDLAPAPVPPTVVPDVVLPPPKRQAKKPPPVEAETKADAPKPPAPKMEQRVARSEDARHADKAAASRSGTGSTGPESASWLQKVSERIARNKRYPARARSRQEEGVVKIRFTIDGAGNVLASSIVTSSGVDGLDAEALALMKRVSPVPPPPPGAPRTITIPIRFNLR